MRIEYDCAERHFIENPYIKLDGVLIRIKRIWQRKKPCQLDKDKVFKWKSTINQTGSLAKFR